jgi:hypothetical protein
MKGMTTCQAGGFAALLSIIFAILYSVAQIATLLHLLPSPYDLIAMFVPSLLLAPAFVITMATLYHRSARHSRFFALVGLCFALLYCAFVSLVYFGQLAAIIPLQLKKETVDSQLLFQGSSLVVAVDCIGYGFMSLATLFTAFAYAERKGLYRSLLVHGLLAPIIIASFFIPVLLLGGALWMITFPWAMIQSYRYFKSLFKAAYRQGKEEQTSDDHPERTAIVSGLS